MPTQCIFLNRALSTTDIRHAQELEITVLEVGIRFQRVSDVADIAGMYFYNRPFCARVAKPVGVVPGRTRE